MAKEMKCGDLMPGCDHVVRAESEGELLQQVAAHAKEAHGIDEVTPDLVEKVKGAIRSV